MFSCLDDFESVRKGGCFECCNVYISLHGSRVGNPNPESSGWHDIVRSRFQFVASPERRVALAEAGFAFFFRSWLFFRSFMVVLFSNQIVSA